MFAVVRELPYSTKVLFTGTKDECKAFIKSEGEFCGDYVYIQELDEVYA